MPGTSFSGAAPFRETSLPVHQQTLEAALDPFIADGSISEVLYQVKSGKEAVVYCCRGGPKFPDELVAAKIYKPRAFRSFRNDAMYREGRVILDTRAARAFAKRTDFGRKVASATWAADEFQTLRRLYGAGASVPRPLALAGDALLLEFIGDEQAAAPMLKGERLEPDEAAQMFDRLLDEIQLWLAYDVIHGDLSAYNVLYWRDAPVVIDFPQACDPRFNPNAFSLLARDIENLGRYFERFGVQRDTFGLADAFWRRYERP